MRRNTIYGDVLLHLGSYYTVYISRNNVCCVWKVQVCFPLLFHIVEKKKNLFSTVVVVASYILLKGVLDD